MLVHEKFIFIHLPKTGGTFVRKCLERAYINSLRNRHFTKKAYDKILKKANYKDLKNKITHIILNDNVPFINESYGQHGGCNEIPEKYKYLPIYTSIRNPFDYYYSLYKFRWWVRNPIVSDKISKKKYPHFPNISFSEYLKFMNTINLNQQLNSDFSNIGHFTWKFIRFYFKEPFKTIRMVENKDYKEALKYMFKVNWLRMENLNEELYNMLIRFGYEDRNINFIKSMDKIRPNKGARKDNDIWENTLDSDDINEILKKDHFIFTLFNDYSPKI